MNKMKFGFFEIESGDNIVSEFIGLRSKMLNSLIETKTEDNGIIIKNKKVKKVFYFILVKNMILNYGNKY